jgi:hypothetical protein
MYFRRIIALAGVGDAEQAEFSALVARAAELIEQPWVVGEDEQADLVVLDGAHTTGMLAQARAAARNALWVAIDSELDDSLLLSRPFELDGVMQLLLSASERLPDRSSSVIGGAQQFGYGRADLIPVATAGISMADYLVDELVGQIPDARSVDTYVPADDRGAQFNDALLLAAAAAIPAASAPAAVREAQAALVAPVAAASKSAPPASAPEPAPAPAPRALYPLLDYLDGKLLGIASRVTIDGAQPLVIDPGTRCFHAAGSLQEIEPYLDTPLARTQWSALLPTQLMSVRRELPGRPFDLLRWHQAMRQQPAGLASKLDPGALYSLRQTLDVAADHPRAARISAVMGEPRKLGDLASLSSTSVVDVYAVVSAYASIGYLVQQARPRAGVPPRAGAR